MRDSGRTSVSVVRVVLSQRECAAMFAGTPACLGRSRLVRGLDARVHASHECSGVNGITGADLESSGCKESPLRADDERESVSAYGYWAG